MIEVPAAVSRPRPLYRNVGFFSIGTNDLCQYWMAADREPSVATLNNPHHLTFLRALLCRDTSPPDGRKWWLRRLVAMGGRPQDLPLMIALGVDEDQRLGSQVLALKQLVRTADSQRCRDHSTAPAPGSGPGAEELLASGSWRARPAPSLSSTPRASTRERAQRAGGCDRPGDRTALDRGGGPTAPRH